MYLTIENTGIFPFDYSIFVQDRHPSVGYMTGSGFEKKRDYLGKSSRSKKEGKGKKSGKSGTTGAG